MEIMVTLPMEEYTKMQDLTLRFDEYVKQLHKDSREKIESLVMYKEKYYSLSNFVHNYELWDEYLKTRK